MLYANRVHNLLGPSNEPGDMRPKGRGRPQRILLGCWPEEQIKGVIRAVVFRDTSVFRENEHKVGGKTKVFKLDVIIVIALYFYCQLFSIKFFLSFFTRLSYLFTLIILTI